MIAAIMAMNSSAAFEGGRSSGNPHSTWNRIGGSRGRKRTEASAPARAVNSSPTGIPAPQPPSAAERENVRLDPPTWINTPVHLQVGRGACRERWGTDVEMLFVN